MLFSAGVTGSFTDCIFLLCLKDIHNELHLPSLHLPCLSAFVLRSMPMSIFSALLAQELFFCTVWISGYSLISFHSSVFMLTFFFFGFPGTVIAWQHSSPLGIESFTHHASFLSCWSSLNVTFISAWICSAAIWLSIIILISSLLFTKCRNKIIS